MVRIKGNF